MSLPGNVLSTVPIPGPFLPPRTSIRATPQEGMTDVHYGGIALGDPSQGITYQIWAAQAALNGDILLSAPNTPQYTFYPGAGAIWVALAFDQNARIFLAWSREDGAAFYYWFNSLIPGYQTSQIPDGGGFSIPRVFATLDDNRPLELSSSDVILAYVRNGELFYRQQRDRFNIEYDLGAAPANFAQLGMSHVNRLQFAFQSNDSGRSLPPSEWLGNSNASR